MGHDFHDEREATARKPHRCCEAHTSSAGERWGCVRTAEIKPGARYVRMTGKFDGEMYSVAMCLRCRRLLRKAWKRYPPVHEEEGPAFGGLLEYLREARR